MSWLQDRLGGSDRDGEEPDPEARAQNRAELRAAAVCLGVLVALVLLGVVLWGPGR